MTVFEGPLFHDSVVGETLRAYVKSPHPSFLLIGPPGSGKFEIMKRFAAALLCDEGGCGVCASCVAVEGDTHLDVGIYRRSGANLEMSEAREIVARSRVRPQFGSWNIVIVPEIHRALAVSSTLLKVVEEPPTSTIFLLSAEGIDQALEALASRCVRVSIPRPSRQAVTEYLLERGVDEALLTEAVELGGHRFDRASLVGLDPEVAAYAKRWKSVLSRTSDDARSLSALAFELEPGGGSKKRSASKGKSTKITRVTSDAQVRRDERDMVRMGLEIVLSSLVQMAQPGQGHALRVRATTEAVKRATSALERNIAIPLILREFLFELATLTD